jgi:hypothetical protein
MNHIETLNVASQCRATASSPLAQNTLVDGGSGFLSELLLDAARAIEQAEQAQPVAWMTFTAYGDEDDIWYENPEGKLLEGWTYIPLYTVPPPRQPEPLTDEEIWKFWWARPEVPDGEDDSMEAEFVAAVRRVLAAHGMKGEA